MELSRRDVLKFGVLGSAALLLPIERVARTKSAANGALDSTALADLKFKAPLYVQQPALPKSSAMLNGFKVHFYDFTTSEVAVPVLNVPGGRKTYAPTRFWGYNGEVPGPNIHVMQGERAIVRHVNGMAGKFHPTLKYEPVTSVHLHGSASLPEYDGYASDVTKPGYYKDYHYPNIQDARTLWYHDHGVHETASNAYMGLAAQYVLHDQNELRLPIPTAGVGKSSGKYDIGLTFRDAIFGSNGQLIYDDNSQSSVMGDTILVNGVPWPKLKVEPRVYRFRLLNGSVSRSFKIALTQSARASSPDLPMTVIATDGGLMPKAQTVTSFRHGMAERYEILIDFSNFKGKTLYLKNLGLPNNVEFEHTSDMMCFEVSANAPTDTSDNDLKYIQGLGQWGLNPNKAVMDLQDIPGTPDETLELIRTNGSWTVNGTTWVDVVNNKYGAPLCSETPGKTAIWEIKNPSGGWFHPFHIHLVDFRILSRNGKAPYAYEQGPKDVVYVGENETVRLAVEFKGPENEAGQKCYADEAARIAADAAKYGTAYHTGQRTGRYMMHCHNLVHEDHDMMGQFWVRPKEQTSKSGDTTPAIDPHHPLYAAPAQPVSKMPAGVPDLVNFVGF
jgi:spore coat protein A